MADVKIGCPQCHQHIQCDAAWLGKTLPCPSCGKEFVAAALTPTPVQTNSPSTEPPEVSPRPAQIAQPGQPPAPSRLTQPALWVSVGAALLLLIGAAFLFLPSLFSDRAGTRARPTEARAQRMGDEDWTLDLSKTKAPDQPARGWIAGLPFTLQRADVVGDTLHLRQGTGFHPELGVSIVLLLEPGKPVSRRSIVVTPQDGLGSPHIELVWNPGDQTIPTRQLHVAGYSLRLDFGDVKENTVSGSLHLCLPDPEKSYVAGTFNATVH